MTANNEYASSDHDGRERLVVRRLRAVTTMVLVMDAITAIMACYPKGIAITDTLYIEHVVPAGGARLAIYLLILAIPGVVVFRRPRWIPIAFWIIWAVSWMSVALLDLLRSEGLFGRNEDIWLMWPAWIECLLFAAMMLGLVFVIPLIRWTHRSAPLHPATALPGARVHRQ